jgi:hypothetical protein
LSQVFDNPPPPLTAIATEAIEVLSGGGTRFQQNKTRNMMWLIIKRAGMSSSLIQKHKRRSVKCCFFAEKFGGTTIFQRMNTHDESNNLKTNLVCTLGREPSSANNAKPTFILYRFKTPFSFTIEFSLHSF